MSSSVRKVCRNPKCPTGSAVDPDTLKQCSRCKQAHYCSKDCQVTHWKDHKVECKACVEQNARLSAGKLQNVKPRPWTFNDDPNEQELVDEEDFLNQWAETMPQRDYRGTTARIRMERLGMTGAFLKGLDIGDWNGVRQRMKQVDAPANIRNSPPLKAGDYVEVQPGNSVKFEMVGQRGVLIEFFRKDKKWGIDMDNGVPSMIMAGNLKRVSRETVVD